MEIRVECPCGTSYEFEVEPVDNRMPVSVTCPHCGAEGTASANASIAAAHPPAAAPRLIVAPPPSTAAVRSTQVQRVATAQRSGLGMGFAGAAAGGFLAMLGWYLSIRLTGCQIGWAAWGVGAVTGLAARVLGRQTSEALGLVAGGCALVAILGGQYLALDSSITKGLNDVLVGAYDARMAYAHEAVKVTSDEEVRGLLVKYSEPDEKEKASQITAQQVAEFRDRELPVLKQFIQGTPSRRQYEALVGKSVRSRISFWLVFKNSFSLFTVLWIGLGLASAFKLASGQTASD